ncbi:MAG: ribonuclease Z [Nitrososphaerales archaeon]|nr:ribonuclease Z [Nitrososphaerales archaeon]
MVRLSVTFLGTSSAAPTKTRGLPAIAVQREGDLILMDCGEGIQRQVMAMGLGLNRDTTILITHLHGDHVTGLLGLLQTMSMAQRTRPLTIVGPTNLSKWLEVTSELLHIGLTFPIRFVPARSGTVLRMKEFNVRSVRADHSIECYSYLVEERERPGVFFPEKAKKLGVPEGKLWSRLQKGGKVKVKGRIISHWDVVGRPRPGRKVGYSGDTRPTKKLVRFFRGCDLLIFDSTFRGSDSDKAVERKHSTSLEAATVAKEARVGRLVLTHFSARYTSVSSLVREARTVFPETIAARDGLKIEVDYPLS